MQTEIEKKIIGQFLIDDNLQEKIDVLCDLNEDLFLDENYKLCLKEIAKIALEGKNPDTVLLYQKLNGKIGIDIISRLTENVISNADIRTNVEILRELKYKRNLIEIIEGYYKNIKTGTYIADIDELKNNLIGDLSALEIEQKSEFIKISEYATKIKEQLGSGNQIEGYSWGISDLDKWTSGIITPRIYVLGGLKKSGKTRFVIHTLTKLHNADIPTAFLSMEMPAYEITKLLYASFTGLNDLRFRSSSFLSREEQYMFETTKINELLLGIECKSGLNLNQVLSRIKRYAKMGYKVIFIDYIQRIKYNRNNSANELEEIATSIADYSRENKVAVVLLSQLNANAENPHEPPSMGSLKGSGGIGEAADTILLFDNLYRRTKKESDKNKVDIYLEQRYGDSGKLTVMADLGACRFKDLVQEQFDY